MIFKRVGIWDTGVRTLDKHVLQIWVDVSKRYLNWVMT